MIGKNNVENQIFLMLLMYSLILEQELIQLIIFMKKIMKTQSQLL